MDDGSRARAKIIERIDKNWDAAKYHPDMVKFKCLINGEFEEVVAYNDIVDYIEAEETQDGIWRFEKIPEHQDPLHPNHKDYKGSLYNVHIRWTNGEIHWQPLKNLRGYDKTTVALYADKYGLLGLPGWTNFSQIAKTAERLRRNVKQAKLHSFRMKLMYMYGFLVPRNYDQALQYDHENGNTKWADATE